MSDLAGPTRYQGTSSRRQLGADCAAQAGAGGWRGRRRAVGVVLGSPEDMGMLGVFLTLRPRKLSATSRPISRLAALDLPLQSCALLLPARRTSSLPQPSGERHGTRQDFSAPASSPRSHFSTLMAKRLPLTCLNVSQVGFFLYFYLPSPTTSQKEQQLRAAWKSALPHEVPAVESWC